MADFRWILEVGVESPCSDDVDQEKQRRLAWQVVKQALEAASIDAFVLVGCEDSEYTFAKVRLASPAYA